MIKYIPNKFLDKNKLDLKEKILRREKRFNQIDKKAEKKVKKIINKYNENIREK